MIVETKARRILVQNKQVQAAAPGGLRVAIKIERKWSCRDICTRVPSTDFKGKEMKRV